MKEPETGKKENTGKSGYSITIVMCRLKSLLVKNNQRK